VSDTAAEPLNLDSATRQLEQLVQDPVFSTRFLGNFGDFHGDFVIKEDTMG